MLVETGIVNPLKEAKIKKLSVFLSGLFFLLLLTGSASATLVTIGTASYDSDNSDTIDDDEHYNLIYHADAPFGPIVWLDYTGEKLGWSAQNLWAAGLDSALTINLLAGYSVNWVADSWRLPLAVDGPDITGYDGTTVFGYNITSSEMGHLYYTELENIGMYDINGIGQPGYGLLKVGDFKNLVLRTAYWSGIEFADRPTDALDFQMKFGLHYKNDKTTPQPGLAIREGQVTYNAPIPEPSTMLLFGVGLLGFAGVNRRRK